ncbi:MAG: hypothetical protein ACK4SY_00545 [Pyrobaculum sp.]
MFDPRTLDLLEALRRSCGRRMFFERYKDVCIAVRLALSNLRGGAILLRPSLLGLRELSDIKTASHLLRKIRREVGPVADWVAVKNAAVAYIYERLLALI